MSLPLKSKLLLVPITRRSAPIGQAQRMCLGAGVGVGIGAQLQHVRRHAAICGPPRFPMSAAQKLIMGGGSILVMMIIPFWALFQMPRWSAKHNNRPYGDEAEEVPPEE
ncbi:uncharacterized protein LOC6567165 [Drosophila grimshawi]|uniref:GH13127 n=1 Tax=Drosophila grimshawi TaxID=7222 RepID=B4JQS6_DROGR|nr:uncharacterized protein LOC6567165 [Drosophila grimshawi]EDV99256.1 GH13127 [Drosophila grimshawi]